MCRCCLDVRRREEGARNSYVSEGYIMCKLSPQLDYKARGILLYSRHLQLVT